MRIWNRPINLRLRGRPNEGLAICRDRDRTLRRGLRRAAAETETRTIDECGAVGRTRRSERRRLAGQGMVEALSGSHTRSIDRTWARVLSDFGHGACPL